ncbi:MAG: hypothetical protein ACK40L_16775 [Hydrogenophaga sp.]|jgi:hypothetical protein|nr:hypothetical protein [Hydrogenophaga sp.]
MPKNISAAPLWSTSSFGQSTDWLASERSELSEHLSQCGAQRGRLQALRSGADQLQSVLIGRVITSVVVVALLLGCSWLVL